MTLEDFFTSTELKDGLTTPDRVTDLITLMQKEKENVNASTWLNVANALATTENKECLDLFVQLDGLSFIDKWLKDAKNDTENSDLEELIVGILRALERFKVDDVRLGIGKTVEGLFGHSSAVVREKAKALYEMWNPIPEITGMESHSGGIGNEENIEQETDKEEVPELVMESVIPVDENPPETELELAGVSDSIPPVTDGEDPTESHIPGASDSVPGMSDSIPGASDSVPGMSDSIPGISNSIPPVTEDGGGDGRDPVETNLTGVSDSIPMAEGSDGGEEELDVSQMLKDIEEENEKQEIASTMDSTTLIPSSNDVENDIKTETSEKDEEMMEGGESSNPKTTSNTESDEDNEDGKKSDVNESENDNNSGSDSSSSKKSTKSQHDDLINKRPSDMELDYGIVDPLELARQVAIEIEQEVDSDSARQSSSSSSSSQSMSGIGIEKEPEVSSVPVETHIQTHVLESEIPIPHVEELESVQNVEKGFSGFDLNQEISSEEVGIGIGIEFPVSTPISIVSASRPEPATELPISPLQFEGALGWKGSAATSAFRRIPEVEKTFSSSSSHRSDGLNFDLNVTESGDDKIEKVDKIDKTENLFSRDKMPVTYHETPRRLEKLELDLNSFSGGIGIGNSSGGIGIGNSSSGIGIGNSSSGIGIGNSGGEIGIGNSSDGIGIGDSSGITLDWNRDSRISSFQNYPPTQSLPFKSIDLNLNDHSNVQNNNNNNPFLSKLFNKQQESVFSLFGTQVEVNRTNSNSNSIPPPSGIDFTLGRPGSNSNSNSNSNSIPTPYTSIPNYTHNGFQMAPMYAPSGGTGGYGTIPYMVPPPQMMQPVYSQPFLYAQSGSNGAGPSRNNFDLNFMGDLGNRENNGGLGLRQFFNTNQRPVDEQQYLRMNNNINISNNNNNNLVQGSSSSVIGGKRQEPESGWDLFSVNYKQQQQNQHHSQHHYPHHQQPPWQ